MIDADDKRRARLNCIRHLLDSVPYEDQPIAELVLPPRQHATYVRPPLQEQNFVTDHYGD